MSLIKLAYVFFARKVAGGFDASFYISHYKSRQIPQRKGLALAHYIMVGRPTGLAPNKAELLVRNEIAEGNVLANFNLKAYKQYNADLRDVFSADRDFIKHYIVHGQHEGRVSAFADGLNDEIPLSEKDKWHDGFSTSEFLAWCGDQLDRLPTTREEALQMFSSRGIARLWPISFRYAFDIGFVRAIGELKSDQLKSDADLYRHWLEAGFVAGVAPNEPMYLVHYLNGLPFPYHFDWKMFADRAGLAKGIHRSRALIALFDAPAHQVIANADVMGEDAAWLLDAIGRRALINLEYEKAAEMFMQSAALSPSAEALCLLGDAYRELGEIENALDAYVRSIELGHAPMWSYLHATSIHASCSNFDAAFTILRQAHPLWREKLAYGQKLHEITRLYFEHQSTQARNLYKRSAGFAKNNRHAADAIITEALDHVKDIYSTLDVIPAPATTSSGGYVSFLANNDLQQCNHYRIEQKLLAFEQAGVEVRFFPHSDVPNFIDSLIGAKAAIFYRVAAFPDVVRAILVANSLNIETYYEIDDLLFDSAQYPDPFESFEGQITKDDYTGLQFGVPLFRYAMSMCKGSIASTPALARQMQTVTTTKASIVVRNGLDVRNRPAILMGDKPHFRDGGRLRIFYGSGTKAHNSDFNKLAAPALLDIMQRHAHIDLVIVGHLRLKPEFGRMGKRVAQYKFISDVTEYWSILAGCDINLAVLEPSLVADCKSEIKWLEAAVLQIPSIVSATQTYHEVVEDGVDGLLVESAAQWRTALSTLVTDPAARRAMGARARAKALANYDIKVAASTLAAAFGQRDKQSVIPPAKRLRILICNVFFAPESHGGATRVVEDNVRDFREFHKDLDIAVFCSAPAGTPPGQLSIGSENGIPVYRLSTPVEVKMDWRPFNDQHAAPFERVLDHFQPDIVHFHCIQRLTATIVEVTQQRSLPYFVTLHDAWWISDNQFLIDSDGLLQLPTFDVLADSSRSDANVSSISRRQRLTVLLQHAEANLSVSAPFAEIYRNAGIDRVSVTENGTSPLTSFQRMRRRDGRLALGHIGGRATHKGALLIEATLRRHTFDNLHLTMVDGQLHTGQSIETVWGNTPVTLIAPVAQSRVGELYGSLDVLLAPSTWPESFGLVTREALASGLWVVASKLGAIAADIQEGQNGFVIDTRTTRDLQTILAKFDADRDRYNRPTALLKKVAFRSTADQAHEIYDLYKTADVTAAQAVKKPAF